VELPLRNPHGHGSFTMPNGEVKEVDTLQCPHCNAHFVYQKGSGVKRHYCTRCMSMTCGAQGCIECTPFEKQLEEIEKGILSGS
jgi:hypothetical protein